MARLIEAIHCPPDSYYHEHPLAHKKFSVFWVSFQDQSLVDPVKITHETDEILWSRIDFLICLVSYGYHQRIGSY